MAFAFDLDQDPEVMGTRPSVESCSTRDNQSLQERWDCCEREKVHSNQTIRIAFYRLYVIHTQI